LDLPDENSSKSNCFAQDINIVVQHEGGSRTTSVIDDGVSGSTTPQTVNRFAEPVRTPTNQRSLLHTITVTSRFRQCKAHHCQELTTHLILAFFCTVADVGPTLCSLISPHCRSTMWHGRNAIGFDVRKMKTENCSLRLGTGLTCPKCLRGWAGEK